MSRAFKQHMASADPRQVVAQVHQRRPTSVALKGSQLHLLSAVEEEEGEDDDNHGGGGGAAAASPVGLGAEASFLKAASNNKSDFMQHNMVAKFSQLWLATQINLLVGVIARIGTE
jgi:hypothetical protein